jgi:hypothetical protein
MYAGPPFITDDPEPVKFRHWEFYLSSAMSFDKSDLDATLPHFEVNYGLIPNVQVHLLVPMAYARTGNIGNYGLGNTEFGFKYRFYEDTSDFQIGIFPLLKIPTHKNQNAPSNVNIQAFLPVWLQKSWGDFTTYGGIGYWYNPGPGLKNWIFAGWEGQYAFSDFFTLGGELYYHTADERDAQPDIGFNLGGFINLSDMHHILLSAGRSMKSQSSYTLYIGYLFTI